MLYTVTLAIYMQHLISLFKAPDFAGYVQQFSYIGVFVWFTIFDFVAPFPDEVSLLTVGYLAAQGLLNPFIAGGIVLFSFVLTDAISFYLARGGSSLITRRLKKPKKRSFRGVISRHLEKNLPVTLILVCFIPKMRMWGPLVSGSTKLTFKKFMTFNAIGVTLFVALYGSLGYFFGKSFSTVFAQLKSMQTAVFVGVLLVFGIVLLFISAKVTKEEHDGK